MVATGSWPAVGIDPPAKCTSDHAIDRSNATNVRSSLTSILLLHTSNRECRISCSVTLRRH